VEDWVDLSTAVKVHSPCSRLYITAAVAINTTVSGVSRTWILSHRSQMRQPLGYWDLQASGLSVLYGTRQDATVQPARGRITAVPLWLTPSMSTAACQSRCPPPTAALAVACGISDPPTWCAENYDKLHNKFIFLNDDQHFGNFKP